MIHIHIEAATAEEAREQARKLFGMQEPEAAPVVLDEPKEPLFRVNPRTVEALEEIEPLTYDGSAAPEEPAAEELLWKEEPKKAEPEITAEEVRAALNKLRKSKGTDTLRKVFTRYGVKTFPELDPAVYGKLMNELKEENNG